jgi:LysR family transcriptional regulator, chromosome initiation inhibitor
MAPTLGGLRAAMPANDSTVALACLMLIPDPGQLEALAAAVAEGTFDAAATRLHVTPSAISQRIKALEISVGRVLVTRTKPVRPTPTGETMLRLARQIQTLTADLARELDQTAAPVLALAVNADSLATWLLPALATLGEAVVFDLHRADQEQTANLLRQGLVMAAITRSPKPVPGCSVQRLGQMRYRPMASPDFVDRWFPTGRASIAELARAPIVVFDRDDHLQDGYLRKRSRRRLDPPRHHIPGSSEFLDAIRLGLGWGMVSDLQRAPLSTDLSAVDPHTCMATPLYWQQWRLHSTALDAVAAAVRSASATTLR